jgi:outer membrane protein OmpU
MKKILCSSTALAAATAMALIPTGDAVAAEKAKKIQLGFGGGMTALIGFANQASSFEGTSDGTDDLKYGEFNTFKSSELEVKGSVKLDSGITVSVEVEFETDQVTANASNAGIDHSYMKITGGFGDVRIGSTTPVTAVLAQGAPWTGATNPGVDDVFWIINPGTNIASGASGKISTGNGAVDTEALQYISPQFAGLRFGVYVIPDKTTATSDDMPLDGGNTGTDGKELGMILNYETKVGAAGSFKTSLGYWVTRGNAAASKSNTDFGLRVKFGDIQVGGSYLTVKHDDSGLSGTTSNTEKDVYAVGVMFAPKGYAVGLHYIKAEAPVSSVAGDDTKASVTLGLKYDLGPGVSAKGSLGYVDYEDELTTDTLNNQGWYVVGGISVAF